MTIVSDPLTVIDFLSAGAADADDPAVPPDGWPSVRVHDVAKARSTMIPRVRPMRSSEWAPNVAPVGDVCVTERPGKAGFFARFSLNLIELQRCIPPSRRRPGCLARRPRGEPFPGW